MLILFSKLFFKIEKRKTEMNDWFSFFQRSEIEWPFDTRINKVNTIIVMVSYIFVAVQFHFSIDVSFCLHRVSILVL
jgi:hypothetical protein